MLGMCGGLIKPMLLGMMRSWMRPPEADLLICTWILRRLLPFGEVVELELVFFPHPSTAISTYLLLCRYGRPVKPAAPTCV